MRSLKIGCGRYTGQDLQDFIKKYDLHFVQRLQEQQIQNDNLIKEFNNMQTKKTLTESQLREYVENLANQQMEQNNYENSLIPGQRRSKVKQINNQEFEQSIE